MPLYFSRRHFLSTGAGALATVAAMRGQTPAIPVASLPVKEYEPRSTVALVSGDDRRKNVYEALLAIDDEIRPKLKTKKRVLIKPNDVAVVNQLACTHVDALRGILDYLAPRFKGPITIGESSAGDTFTGFRNFRYTDLPKEYKSHEIELVDFNQEGKYVNQALLDQDAHVVPVRLAARLFDPDAYIIGCSLLKSHNYAVVTLGLKNMILGAPLHSPRGAAESFNHKVSYHAGFHLVHYNMLVTAQSMAPYWSLSVIDGFEGMEGNGPAMGTPVDSRLAIASTDFVAADRVGVECMGVNPEWVGYMQYCGILGLGNTKMEKIDIRGAKIASVQKKYRLASDIDRQMQWIGPLEVDDGSWIGPRGIRSDIPRNIRRRPPQP
ncbi:MAG: DUF362 domain-containing protein [bacterium]